MTNAEFSIVLRKRFFSTPIPTNRPLTRACLAAGDKLSQFLSRFSPQQLGEKRDECFFGAAGAHAHARLVDDLAFACDLLPDAGGKAEAVVALGAYAAKLRGKP